jgi:hypothetical protein
VTVNKRNLNPEDGDNDPINEDDIGDALREGIEHLEIADLETEAGSAEEIKIIKLLTRDLRAAAEAFGPRDARYAVDLYYQMQAARIRAAHFARTAGEAAEPNFAIADIRHWHETLEGRVAAMLHAYAKAQPVGLWMLSLKGIGRVIAAGLLAHIDISRSPTVGHIWSFAGLNPDVEWLGQDRGRKLVQDVIGDAELAPEHLLEIANRTHRSVETIQRLSISPATGKQTKQALAAGLARRPWNADLKRLCWLLGESFVKVSNREGDVYGHIYVQRKLYEQEKNLNGDYADVAANMLATRRIGKETKAYQAYADGKLPDGHIHSRSKRYAVKLFLSALHEVLYWDQHHQLPPLPYIIATSPMHTHYRGVPHLDAFFPDLLAAKKAAGLPTG